MPSRKKYYLSQCSETETARVEPRSSYHKNSNTNNDKRTKASSRVSSENLKEPMAKRNRYVVLRSELKCSLL
uniref:Uncharacterized protein n=1 Tax=Solanum tuberosum TaxID=4113 RepID=M1B6I3_SOLTU